MEVPVWAWMNRLAHGTARQIGACVIRSDKPRRAGRSWRAARSSLAFEVLDLTDLEITLAEVQWSVLIRLYALEWGERISESLAAIRR